MPGNRRCWTIEPEVTATARWVDLEQSSFLSSVGIFRSSQLSERPSMHETLLSHSGFSGGELEGLCVHLPPPSLPWCPPLTRCRVDTQRRRGTCFPERALCVPLPFCPLVSLLKVLSVKETAVISPSTGCTQKHTGKYVMEPAGDPASHGQPFSLAPAVWIV